MEQRLQILASCLVCDRLLPLVANYPWLHDELVQISDEHMRDLNMNMNMNNPLSYYPCQNPALMGRRIRGCFHGWVILSSHPDNVKWFLWNPTTLKTIHLPPLVLKEGDVKSMGGDCCLPSPPDEIGSVLLLSRAEQRTFVFCRLDRKRKRLKWTEMTYAKQLESITGLKNGFLNSLTCCSNGKVYALNNSSWYYALIQVDIVVKQDEEVVINLLPFVRVPFYRMVSNGAFTTGIILKGGTDDDLFYVVAYFDSEAMRRLSDVILLKLDMTSMIWEKPEEDLVNHTVFFVDRAHHRWLFYRPTTVSLKSGGGGGYIHIFGKEDDKVISSYNIKDNTVSLSSMPNCLMPTTSHVPFWVQYYCRDEKKEEEDEEDKEDKLFDINSTRMNSPLLDITFDVLKTIMEFCVGVEYLNFRATCKHCKLAAPVIRWSNETSLRRLRFQTYSLPSPWLMVFDTDRDIITFTDPMFGDKYFMKTPQELIGDVRVHYSINGWLLVTNLVGNPFLSVMLFNPFTNDIRKLPASGYRTCTCFSAPPTSWDCMVVGFVPGRPCVVCVHFVNLSSEWGLRHVDFGEIVPRSISFPTLYGRDVYALEAGGRLDVYRVMEDPNGGRFWEVVAEAPGGCSSGAQCFLVKCDKHRLLLVRVNEYGESVEVFKLNDRRSTQQYWEKMDGLGRRMIYICDATCFCIKAKTPEMENKIYFPRLQSKNGKTVFYSLETCRYHTFSGRKVEEESFGNFLGTKYILSPHAWIEPSWC